MRRLFLFIILFLAFPLFAQERPLSEGLNTEEQLSLVGITISDLIEGFGPPAAVAVARGSEIWQDDVVFQYHGLSFYIHRDRVWQVGFSSAYGVSIGAPKTSVLAVLGNTVQDNGNHLLMPISGRDWPLMLRVNFLATGRVNTIYIYRSDF